MSAVIDQQTQTANMPVSEIVSEKLAEALRNEQSEAFITTSPYVACLLPLLRELGWYNSTRNLIEALPHFSEQIDLVDLRNILVCLGYESSPLHTRIEAIKPELFPCLFVSQNNDVYILMDRQGDQVRFFDAQRQAIHDANLTSIKGTVYVFTDVHSAQAAESSAITTGGQDPWFFNLLQRFRGIIIHLLGMTFAINLVTLIVPLFVMMVCDKVIGAKSADTLPYLVVGVGFLLLADLALRYLRASLIGSVAGRQDYLIGVETFKHLLFLPPLYTERSIVAAQLSRLKQFDSVRDFFTGPSAATTLELPFVFLFIAVIAILAGPIALIPLAMVVIYALFGLLWLPTLNSKISRSSHARTDKQRVLIQTLTGRREIKAIGGERVWWSRFRKILGEAVMANYHMLQSSNIMSIVSRGVMTLSAVAVLGLITLQVIEGTMSVGALIATMALVWRVLSPLQNAFLSYSKFQQTLKAIRQINLLMQLKVERQSGHSGLMIADIQGRISVDRVSFRYGPCQDPTLLGVSFDAQPGELVVIVGDTGSGKSTLLKLIAGMYQPQAGTLTIDDMDLRQINAMDLRRSIAYVPQESKLFHGTIAQNMRLNNGLATDQELHAAAKRAAVLEDILMLPDGFHTRIGDSFTDHLPPGFLRGLSMARAFVSPARILLLDEPGASLDEESDHRFIKQLKCLRGDHTVIMVSHRPSHIRLADKVILLEQGSVLYSGSADEVIAKILENAA